MVLGLSYQTVQGMGNGDDFLSQIIAAWLKQQDNVLRQSGEPTWNILADKLEEIGCTEIAADVRRKDEGPKHRGENEQQDGNLLTLSTDAFDSLRDGQLSSTNMNELLNTPYSSGPQIIAPISIQPVIQSQQDQPHTR